MTSALARVERCIFEPETLPEGGVVAVALLPSLVMGLVFYRQYAAVALAIALLVGVLAQVLSWRLRLAAGVSPAVAALVGAGLLGAAAPREWFAIAAGLGSALELARRRWAPELRLQGGLVAAVVVLLTAPAVHEAYLNPGRLRPLAEPVRLWWQYAGGGGAAPIDPVRLYVGNVPGPVFATSLLAVAVGAAWLWYARRLSLGVLAAFLVGAALPIGVWGWNPGYQLDSGPTWFAAALVLADRTHLPRFRAARPLLGLAAGVAGIGLRGQGLGVEAVFFAVAGLQLTVAAIEGAEALASSRRRPAGRVAALRGEAPAHLAGTRTAG